MESNYISMALGLVISMSSLKVFIWALDYLIDKLTASQRTKQGAGNAVNSLSIDYIVALVASFCVICIGTNLFSQLLEISEK